MDLKNLKKEQDQKLQRACNLIKIKATRRQHTQVNRLLEMTRPHRLHGSVLIHLLECEYPIEQIMDHFTPPDCKSAFLKAVEKGNAQTVMFLLDFLPDTVDLLHLASLAIQNNDAHTLQILCAQSTKEEKLRLLRRSCFKTSTDSHSKTSLSPCEIAEILLEDTSPAEIEQLIEQAVNTPTFQNACNHVYMLRQHQTLTNAVEHTHSTHAPKRKI